MIQRTCIECEKTFDIQISEDELTRFVSGEHIQDLVPKLDINLRELIVSGICGWCFDRLFE